MWSKDCSAEPSPEPKWTPGIIHRYYDPRGSGIWTFQPRKAQKADPRNKASQTFCGTFSGTKVNPWTHPQILRPAGVRNLDLSAPKSSKSGPPQQSLPDVLRNLLRNQSEPLDSSTDTTTRGGPEFGPFSPEKLKKRTPATKPRRRSAEPSPEPKWTPGLIHRYYDPRGSGIWTFRPRKAQKADPRNKASQTFCGTFSGTKVNPWTHPQILRPAGVRNLDLSAPKKLKKRTPATKPPRRSAEPSPEPKWTPGLIHTYYDPRGSGIWTFQPRKAQKADPRNKASQTFCGTFSGTKVNPWNHPQILRPAGVRNLDLSAPKSSKSGPPQVDKQPAPRTQTSASALTGRGCQCAVLNVLLFQPPLRALPQSLLGQERISGHVRPWLAPPPPPILLSSHLPEDCIWEKAICQKNASEKKPSARRMTSEKRIKLDFNSSDTCPVGWKLEKN